MVPKGVVRLTLASSSDDYYNRHVIEYLRDEALKSASSLVRTMKDGSRKVFKKDISAQFPKRKPWLLDFSNKHPEVLEHYRRQRTSRPLKNHELQPDLDERNLSIGLIAQLEQIPPGRDAADDFHAFMMAALEFAFYPQLQCPRKEWEIHEGRKRIDIVFANEAERGFFKNRFLDPQLLARVIVIECKNYANDIANPELDQLANRFGAQRGRFGIVVTRSLTNRKLFFKRCRDTFQDGNGLILPLVDDDMRTILQLAGSSQPEAIDIFLTSRMQDVIAA
jgi:hypothetical protein